MARLSDKLGERGVRIAKRSGAGLAGAFVLFGLVSYLWLPGYVKGQMEVLLSEELKRPVTIQQVSISPYNLAATVEGLKAGDVLSVGRLYVNLSSSSLFRLIPVVEEVRVDQPRLHLVRESEQRLNVSDVIDAWMAKPSGPTPEFSVSNITMTGGHVEWIDNVVGKTQVASDIRLGIPFIANVPSKVEVFVEPQFSAKFNGAPIDLSGKVKPFGSGHDAIVSLALNDLDLAPVSAYVSLPVETKSALLDSHLQVVFQRRDGAAASLLVTGDLALREIRADMPARKLGLYVPMLAVQGVRADVFGQKVAIKHISLRGQGEHQPEFAHVDKPFVRLAEFALSDLAVDVPKRNLALGEAKLTGPALDLTRNRKGMLDVLDGSTAVPSKAPDTSAASAVGKQDAPWSWSLGKSSLVGGKLHFQDENLPNIHPLELSELSAEVGKLSSVEDQPATVALQMTVNERGRLVAQGELDHSGKAAIKLDATQVDLVSLQGWVIGKLNAILTRGDLGFQGDLHVAGDVVDLAGDLTLSDLNVLDRINSDDMLRWKQLSVSKLNFHSQPFSLEIGDVALRDFFAQLLVNSKGQLNLKGILNKEQAPEKPGAVPAAEPAVAAAPQPPVAPAKAEPPLHIRIGKIVATGGTVDFTDEFIQPHYSARLTNLIGRVGTVAAGVQSPLEITGKVDRAAPVKISGKVAPFNSPLWLDIQASAKGVDLPNMSGYSGRYLGYPIVKGKLSMDVSYRIANGELQADNKLFLDQLTLGDKVESSSALDIPVKLAISLLKNSRGEIDLDLPIHGSLNDPQFNIGSIVVKVLVNFVVKAVTSPFALLGSLFGGGEDLSNVAFPNGLDTLTPDIEKRLGALSKAMADRPGLQLEVTGFADPGIDRDGLKQALLMHKVKVRKVSDQARRGKATVGVDEVELTAEEYPVYLEKVYRDEDFPGKPRNAIGLLKSLSVPEMEALMLAHIPVTEADLTHLAEERGLRVQNWLTEQGGVAMERVFLLKPQIVAADKGPGNLAVFSLR